MTTDRAAFEAALDLLILYVAGDIEEEAEEASTEAAEARKSTLALYDTLAAEGDKLDAQVAALTADNERLRAAFRECLLEARDTLAEAFHSMREHLDVPKEGGHVADRA
jgi:phage I-like protein